MPKDFGLIPINPVDGLWTLEQARVLNENFRRIEELYIPDKSIKLAKIASEAWIDYDPTITQSNTPTKSITYSRYELRGRTVVFEGIVVFTSAGTSLNPILMTLPVQAAVAAYMVIGAGYFYTGAGGKYPLLVELNGSATVARFTYTTVTTDNVLGSNSPFAAAIANGNALTWALTYETNV